MAKKFNLELTEQQFNVVVEAMQFHDIIIALAKKTLSQWLMSLR